MEQNENKNNYLEIIVKSILPIVPILLLYLSHNINIVQNQKLLLTFLQTSYQLLSALLIFISLLHLSYAVRFQNIFYFPLSL